MARTKQTLIDPDVQLLQALAHPTRLSIVRELTGTSEVCACDFTSCCDVQQPTVSHHLRILKEAGVIAAQRRGTSIYYYLLPAAAERLQNLVGELRGRSGPELVGAESLRRTTAPASPATPARPS